MATTKKKTVKEKIPCAIRGGAVGSAEDLLAGINAVATKVSKTVKPTHPTMELAEDSKAALKEWVPAKILADHFATNLEIVVSNVNRNCFAQWIKNMFASKTKPANPVMKIDKDGKPDMEAMYIVTKKIKTQFKNTAEFEQQLRVMGFSDEKIQSILSEFDFTALTTVRFNELIKGHKEGDGWAEPTEAEKNVATKILKLLKDNLTSEEIALAVQSEENCRVKDGFLERVVGYCDTEEQLQKLMEIATPVKYPSKGKFGLSDDLVTKNNRLLEAAGKVLGGLNLDNE